MARAVPATDGALPVLYSFRRCPFAMRARLALLAAGQRVELREILLRDKPAAMLEASPKGTVPVLVRPDGSVLEESLDIMRAALAANDPQGWLDMPGEGHALIAACDGPFKTGLDRYKYASRHPEDDPTAAREAAATFLHDLEGRLAATGGWLFGPAPRLADMATLTFVRQYAMVDRPWFDAQPWPNVIAWLERFLASDAFAAIMIRPAPWAPGDAPLIFPTDSTAPPADGLGSGGMV